MKLCGSQQRLPAFAPKARPVVAALAS